MKFSKQQAFIVSKHTSTITILFSSLLIVLICVGLIAGTSSYFVALVTQPHIVSSSELQDPAFNDMTRYFITVEGTQTLDTGYTYSLDEKNQKLLYYGALTVNDKFLLIESDSFINENAKSYTGRLFLIPSNLQAQVINDIYMEYPELSGQFLPIMLSTTDSGIGLLIAALLSFLGIISGFLIRSTIFIFNPLADPIFKRLRVYGNPVKVVEEIVTDINLNGKQVDTVHFGRKWLLHSTNSNFHALKYSDIVWAYQLTTITVAMIIPVGRTRELIIKDRFEREYSVSLNKKNLDTCLRGISHFAPHVIVEYKEEFQKMWRKNRKEFIKGVEEIRDMLSKSPPLTPP